MIEMIVMKKRDIMEHLLLHWWSATIGATADDDDGGDDDDDDVDENDDDSLATSMSVQIAEAAFFSSMPWVIFKIPYLGV